MAVARTIIKAIFPYGIYWSSQCSRLAQEFLLYLFWFYLYIAFRATSTCKRISSAYSYSYIVNFRRQEFHERHLEYCFEHSNGNAFRFTVIACN